MSSNTPNVGLPYVPENTLDPAAGLNLALRVIDVLIQTAVINMDQTAPPATGADGDLYIVAGTGGTATGDWAGHELDLARFVDDGNYWEFYEAGTQVHYVLNKDDGGLYKFIEGSPDSWVLAAGLSDAPSDGTAYLRRNGLWVALPGSLTVQDTDSPPTVAVDETNVLIIGEGLDVVEVSAGVAMVSARKQYPAVVEWIADTLDATPLNAGEYTRFSGTDVEYNFDDAETYEIGAEYHGRNVGTSTVTIVGVGGFSVNPPAGGTLVIPPDGTFTVKIVADDEADLFGVTEDA